MSNTAAADAKIEGVAGTSAVEIAAPRKPAETEEVQAYEARASTQSQWQQYAKADELTEGPESVSCTLCCSSHQTNLAQISQGDRDKMTAYFTEPIAEAILALHARIVNNPKRHARDYGHVQSEVIDRQLRTEIHQALRTIFKSRLQSMTDNDGRMIISALPAVQPRDQRSSGWHHDPRNKHPRGNNNKGFSHNKPSWQELGGEHLHFTLYKENKDTMECISWLTKSLNMNAKDFQFAGTKDRRAVSSQRVCAYRVPVARMIDAGRSLRQAKLGDFEYQQTPLQLGDLTGNEFTITLRDCEFLYPSPCKTVSARKQHAASVVQDTLNSLYEKGFINYFGLQRFGTFAIGTEFVGTKMLQGDFKGAVDAILDFNPELLTEDVPENEDKMSKDDKARAKAIHEYQTTGVAWRAVQNLPRKFAAERAIMNHLGRKGAGNDYVGALQGIARNLRLMYVHAYQSLVWNMVASERWKLFGNRVVEGDLIIIDKSADRANNGAAQVDEAGEVIVEPSTEDRAHSADDMFVRARPLSADEASSGRFTLFDLVLPTPGFDVVYPANEVGKFYETFMSSERGGALDPHSMRRANRDFSLSGSYRKLLARPGKEYSYELHTYDGGDQQFVETDLDRLEASKSKDSEPVKKQDESVQSAEAAPGQKDEGQGLEKSLGNDQAMDDVESDGGVTLEAPEAIEAIKMAVVLKLQLGSSQYATMALRELMKEGGVKTYKPDFSGGR